MKSILVPLLLAGGVAAADEPQGITLVKSVTASSTLAAKDPRRYAPERIFDLAEVDAEGPPSSAWCEGKPDEGIGETLTIELAAPTVVETVAIEAGFWKKEELFRANNRVTGIDVITDDGRTKSVTFGDEMEEQKVDLGGAPVRTITLKLTKVKKGKMNDSCISQVTLKTKPETSIVYGMDPALVQSIVGLQRGLAHCDAAELGAVVAFPLSWISADSSEQGEKPRKFKSAAALAKACKDDEPNTRPRTSPGFNRRVKKGVTYLYDAGCGADCMEWGFRQTDWKLVWVGPLWDEPK
jgi:hypothetical protein